MSIAIEQQLQQARQQLSDYCCNVCQAKCCRSGCTTIKTVAAVELIIGHDSAKFRAKGYLRTNADGHLSLLHDAAMPCPKLQRNNEGIARCTVHGNESRPSVCNDYPLFLNKDRDTVIPADNCQAVQQGLLTEFFTHVQQSGYKISWTYNNGLEKSGRDCETSAGNITTLDTVDK